MGTVDQSKENYKAGYAAYFKQNADMLEGWAKSNEQFAEINRGANSPILKSMSDTSTGILSNLNLIRTGFDDLNLQQLTNKINKGLDEPTQGLVNATKALITNQIQLDQVVMKNLPMMAEVATQLHTINAGIIQSQGSALDALKMITSAAKDSMDKVKSVAEDAASTLESVRTTMLGGSLPTPRPAEPPRGPTQNQPQQAEGGVTSGPTTVGENGPEAVIPLKSGGVPMNIDWTPLVQIMQENANINREILDAMEDSVDVQQRILQASY
jgi:hypothetical protein